MDQEPREIKMQRARFHYYGDIVRELFVVGGAVMAITLPFIQESLGIPIFISVLGVLVIGIAAGLMNPMQIKIMALNLTVSIGAFFVFEYYAVSQFAAEKDLGDMIFLLSQALAVVFFIALYFSVKTLRAALLRKSEAHPNED